MAKEGLKSLQVTNEGRREKRLEIGLKINQMNLKPGRNLAAGKDCKGKGDKSMKSH